MGFWTSVLCCSLVVLVVSSQQEEGRLDDFSNDNLKTALDAVSRRQRDLTSAEPGYYGLGSYRYPKVNTDDISFLSGGKDYSENGQPENIGYGYQKAMGSSGGPGRFPSQSSPGSDSSPDPKELEELALEVLNMGLKIDDDGKQYYPSINDAEKRSAFRERDMPEHAHPSNKFDNNRKRGNALGLLPSSFRERTHLTEDKEGKRRRFAEAVSRRLEEEKDDDDEEGYEELVGSLLDRYLDSSNIGEIDKLTDKEFEELLEYLSENGVRQDDINGVRLEAEKRFGSSNGYGAGYDFFNNGAAMSGGFGYKKRNKQRLDDTDASTDAFLFSLKFVSPEMNSEAVEQLRETDGLDLSDESDIDIMKLGLKYNKGDERQRGAAQWFPGMKTSEAGEFQINNNQQGLFPSRNFKSVKYQDKPSEFLLPERQIEKKFLYDRALLKRKRFPVSKRSSNYYTNPPLLHHHTSGERKKKNAPEVHATDPKVASELTQIFSSSSNDNSNENVKIVPQIIGNHVVTKQKAILVPAINIHSTPTTTVAAFYDQHNQSVIEDRPNDDEIELPITMSRIEVPIEVKKKSIDWSDYFGLDRRRKKTGPSNSAVGGDWMLNQYYKTLALSANPNKHNSPHHISEEMKRKKSVPVQPFDTRLFDADIPERYPGKKRLSSEGDDPRTENMDSKLRNLEDLIVNEAVKYTGAHEGTIDSKEIQEVKDQVMTRLVAAYNLEKMRRALGEFKSSLTAQKVSKYNPELRQTEDKRKRVAFKKERAEEKRGLSEGDMGNGGQNELDCPILENIAKSCRAIEIGSGDRELTFLPICALHQICHLCGPELGSSCDGLFLSKADGICEGDGFCERAAIRALMLLKRLPPGTGMSAQCWEGFCAAQSPLLPAY